MEQVERPCDETMIVFGIRQEVNNDNEVVAVPFRERRLDRGRTMLLLPIASKVLHTAERAVDQAEA
jgi:hypothetical protein